MLRDHVSELVGVERRRTCVLPMDRWNVAPPIEPAI
jgi:hypothetical protein